MFLFLVLPTSVCIATMCVESYKHPFVNSFNTIGSAYCVLVFITALCRVLNERSKVTASTGLGFTGRFCKISVCK